MFHNVSNRPLIRKALRRALTRTFPGVCLLNILVNYRARLRLKRGDIETESGMAHKGRDLIASIAYIDRVYAEYRQLAGVERFFGRVAEIGPGDSCGVALRFLEDGCSSVDLIDRFRAKRDERQQEAVLHEIVRRSQVLDMRYAGSNNECQFAEIRRHHGEDASAEYFFSNHRNYDLIVSRAVMEHVRDPILSLRRQGDALVPGGMMLHAVDLRDHGLFTNEGFEETRFLESPRWLHRAMTKDNGGPNRVPLSKYRGALDPRSFEVKFKITSLVGSSVFDKPLDYDEIDPSLKQRAVEIIRSRRRRFAYPLSLEGDRDLSISGFFMVARKRDEFAA